MGGPSTKTDTITVRLLRTQIEALKNLPNGENPSSVLRVLVQLYLDGQIAQMIPQTTSNPQKLESAEPQSQITQALIA